MLHIIALIFFFFFDSTFKCNQYISIGDWFPDPKSCLTLCYTMDWSLPDSSVHGILQARIPEWVAISFSRGFSWPRDQTHISCISCIGMQIFYYQLHLGSPHISVDPLLIIFFFAFSTFAFIHVQVRSLFNIFLTNSLHCLFFFSI